MTEAILLALWVGTALFFIVREIKAKNDRERHEWWLSDLKDSIHSVENEFRRQCQQLIENNFLHRNYQNSIDELKKQYVSGLYSKLAEKKRASFNTIPDYIIREYERNISEIADTFRDFEIFMKEQAIEKK